ncbi:unnamed protein product [Phytomonas sp. Hart1]|nr:unnamed protein product [Phytomonas sp. Hart1]|eukprot:CCW66134.1 unnamed protein product [Phytomonas sp. isolate Hart1]
MDLIIFRSYRAAYIYTYTHNHVQFVCTSIYTLVQLSQYATFASVAYTCALPNFIAEKYRCRAFNNILFIDHGTDVKTSM